VDEQPEPTLRDLFVLLRRGLPFAAAVAVAAAALTYLLSARMTPDYSASATLLVSRPNSSLQSSFGVSLVTAPVIDVTAYQAAVTSRPVMADALATLGVAQPTPRDLADFERRVDVRVENAQQSSLVHIAVRGPDPDEAAAAANALARALLRWDEDRATQNLRNVVETLESQLRAIDEEIATVAAPGEAAPDQLEGLRSLRAERANQLNAARALLTSAVGLVEVLEPAVPPLTPVAPRPVRNAALAFVLGAFLVYGVVLLRDALDTRFRSGEDLVRSTDLPLLAEFPRMAPGTRLLPREASSYLRTNLTFATSSAHPKVLLVTSAGASQGKTSVACSLAESFARNDYRTLIVDCDLRRPMVAEVFGVDAGAWSLGMGVPTVRQLLEDPTLEGKPVPVRLGTATLDVLPQFGPAPSPAELLSRGFPSLLNRFKDEYDVIVIDTPPMLPVADTLTMAPHTTGVVLAVSMPDTDRRSVTASVDLLERIGVRILGLVATNMEKTSGRAGDYGYGYGYGYGGDDRGQGGDTGGGRQAARAADAALVAGPARGGQPRRLGPLPPTWGRPVR